MLKINRKVCASLPWAYKIMNTLTFFNQLKFGFFVDCPELDLGKLRKKQNNGESKKEKIIWKPFKLTLDIYLGIYNNKNFKKKKYIFLQKRKK